MESNQKIMALVAKTASQGQVARLQVCVCVCLLECKCPKVCSEFIYNSISIRLLWPAHSNVA